MKDLVNTLQYNQFHQNYNVFGIGVTSAISSQSATAAHGKIYKEWS